MNDFKYLKELSKQYPNISAASAEIINSAGDFKPSQRNRALRFRSAWGVREIQPHIEKRFRGDQGKDRRSVRQYFKYQREKRTWRP